MRVRKVVRLEVVNLSFIFMFSSALLGVTYAYSTYEWERKCLYKSTHKRMIQAL